MKNQNNNEIIISNGTPKNVDWDNRMLAMNQFQRTATPDFPKNMLMELTNACNHMCIFCTNHKMTRPISQINKKLAYKLLEESYLLGTREVGFYATGEPLMNKDLHLYVKKAKDIGFDYVYITTNGALATPNRIKPIIDAGIDSIKFSINAGTHETYKKMHGEDDFDLVLNNLEWISTYRSESEHTYKIYVSYVITRQNQHELPILKNRIAAYIDHLDANPVTNQILMVENTKDLCIDNSSFMTIPCSMVFNRLHITCEGYLTICCVDFQNYLVVADLNKSSLEESWNNDFYVGMRKRHLNNELDKTLCNICASNKIMKIEPLLPQYATLMSE